MERRKFTREFKLEAVKLIKDRGVSYAQAAQDLGVHQSQLRGWAKQFAFAVFAPSLGKRLSAHGTTEACKHLYPPFGPI
jgi:hypothetical protein